MARRKCSNCGKPATEMKPRSGQIIPICGLCLCRLNTPIRTEPFCPFHEVQPEWLRPADGPVESAVETNSPTDFAGPLRGVGRSLEID